MSRINSYLEVLNEETVKGSKLKPNSGFEGAEKNATIDDLEVEDSVSKPEAPAQMQGVEEKTTKLEGVKYNNMRNNNPFERLYREAINEDLGEEPVTDSQFDGESGFDDMGGDEYGDEGSEMDADPQHIGKVKEAAELLQQALEILQDFTGEEQEEYDELEDEDTPPAEDEDFEGGDFGGDEDSSVSEEQTDMKSLGHALVNRDQLNKGMNKHSNMVVKGAVPNVGKKAKAPTEKRGDGTLSNLSHSGGDKLKSKGNMKVKAKRYDTPNRFAFED